MTKHFQIAFDNGADIKYELYDTRLTTAWYTMLEAYMNCSMFNIQDEFERFDHCNWDDYTDSLIEVALKLLSHIDELEVKAPQEVVQACWDDVFTIEHLHILHKWYEDIRPVYDEHIDDLDDVARRYFITNMHLFNDRIHRCEMFIKDGILCPMIGPRPRIKVRYTDDVYNASAPIKALYHPEDRQNFRPKMSGHLYVTYAQVGKAPMSVYSDQDDHTIPVDWTEFGPSFYATFFGHDDTRDYDAAEKWLTKQFGEKEWLLGEPEIGKLAGMTPEEAFEVIGESRKIVRMVIY